MLGLSGPGRSGFKRRRVFDGTLQLDAMAAKRPGTWSGTLGNARPITGTPRDAYVALSFYAHGGRGNRLATRARHGDAEAVVKRR